MKSGSDTEFQASIYLLGGARFIRCGSRFSRGGLVGVQKDRKDKPPPVKNDHRVGVESRTRRSTAVISPRHLDAGRLRHRVRPGSLPAG